MLIVCVAHHAPMSDPSIFSTPCRRAGVSRSLYVPKTLQAQFQAHLEAHLQTRLQYHLPITLLDFRIQFTQLPGQVL